MKIIKNVGADRLVDVLHAAIGRADGIDVATARLSLYAVAELLRGTSSLPRAKLMLPDLRSDLHFLGGDADRAARNRLDSRALTGKLALWVESSAEVRIATAGIPQGAVVLRGLDDVPLQAALGAFAMTTDGLGLTPGNPLSFIQASETAEEAAMIAQWLAMQWAAHPERVDAKALLLAQIHAIASVCDPTTLYALILKQIFSNEGDALDVEGIVKSATGIRDTLVWKKLYRFQRDGVIGVIEKLGKFGVAKRDLAAIVERHGVKSGAESLMVIDRKSGVTAGGNRGTGCRRGAAAISLLTSRFEETLAKRFGGTRCFMNQFVSLNAHV
jgi:hypothetical protein